jgi:hypothetical protein
MTAVEWLINQLTDNGIEYLDLAYEIIEQAKEIEEQQIKKMYSEEEVKKAFKIGFNIGYSSQVSELDLKEEHCNKWFEQFKK